MLTVVFLTALLLAAITLGGIFIPVFVIAALVWMVTLPLRLLIKLVAFVIGGVFRLVFGLVGGVLRLMFVPFRLVAR